MDRLRAVTHCNSKFLSMQKICNVEFVKNPDISCKMLSILNLRLIRFPIEVALFSDQHSLYPRPQ